MQHFKNIIAAILSTALLCACGQQQTANNTIKVGTIAGPETKLMEAAKDEAKKKYGLKIIIVQFNDYNMPNQALADGSIDANMFQHQPYLNETSKIKGYQLIAIGKTFIYPMGLYSNKIKKLTQLKPNAIVAVPNDPSNEARALLLLQKAHLITLNLNTGINATIKDIAKNPLKLQFKELDAAQLPRILPDVALAAINTNYALVANLKPSKDAIFIEGKDSPYANIIVVRAVDQNNPRLKQLVSAFHSNAVLQLSKNLFKGQAIPAW